MKKGQLCSVNKQDDGQVYMIEEIEGFTAHLSYNAGAKTSKTSIDVDFLRKPTQAQMENEYKTTREIMHQLSKELA